MMMTLGKPAGAGLQLQLLVIASTLLFASVRCMFLYDGDPCTLKDGSNGVCQESTQCPWFLETIVKKKRYNERVTCGFDGAVEVICCKSDAPVTFKPGVRSGLACEQVPTADNRLTFHIIDGEEVADGEFPFMAALGYKSEEPNVTYDYRCGASLISPNFLLTAAHCIPRQSRPEVALLGTSSLASMNPGVVVRIKEFYPHPDYKAARSYNDIALIELERKLEKEPDVNPICIRNEVEDLPKDVVLTAEGFGIVDVDNGDSCTLKDGSNGVCQESTQCPWFLETIVKKKRYNERVTCGFDGAVEVICCKSDAPVTFKPGVRSGLACEQVPTADNRLTFHIIDGEEVADGEFPFMAALGYKSEELNGSYDYRCGASLISPNFLLTAAHCIPRQGRPEVALLGTSSLASMNPGVVVRIKEFYPHPDYKAARSYNDIALIELERKLEKEPDVNPICIRNEVEDLPKDVVLTAEGFGIVDVDKQLRSPQLMKVNLTTVAVDKCNETFATNNLLANNRRLPQGIIGTQYCATGRENVLTKQVGDTCQGDSGGPLQIIADDKFQLVGVTSFGNGCGSNTPSVYTRVARYIEWIESVVWPNGA